MTDEEMVLTYERVESHSLCCDRCKALRLVAREALEAIGQFEMSSTTAPSTWMPVIAAGDKLREALRA